MDGRGSLVTVFTFPQITLDDVRQMAEAGTWDEFWMSTGRAIRAKSIANDQERQIAAYLARKSGSVLEGKGTTDE